MLVDEEFYKEMAKKIKSSNQYNVKSLDVTDDEEKNIIMPDVKTNYELNDFKSSDNFESVDDYSMTTEDSDMEEIINRQYSQNNGGFEFCMDANRHMTL